MTPRALVTTADDGGFDQRGDDDILACVDAGAVTAVSLVATGKTWRDMAHRATRAGADIGLHVNLTDGEPLGGPYRTLTDDTGRFHAPKEYFHALLAAGALDDQEITTEVRAQWEALATVGLPRFVNGHNHVHVCPQVLRALDGTWTAARPFLRVPTAPPSAAEPFRSLCAGASLGALRRRGPTLDAFVGWRFLEDPRRAAIVRELSDTEGQTCEWMTHPGARPDTAFGRSPDRTAERHVLCDRSWLPQLHDLGFTMRRFRDLHPDASA